MSNKILIIFAFLFMTASTVHAVEQSYFIDIVAEKRGCSRDRPCVIEVKKVGDIVRVISKKARGVSETGVLQYGPGSLVAFEFSADGKLLETNRGR